MTICNASMHRVVVLLASLAPSAAAAAWRQSPLDLDAIRDAAQTRVSLTEDGVARIGWLREEVDVVVDGASLPPPAGLGSWAGFTPTPDGEVMVMGDIVLFEDEIAPAMDAAFAHGLDVTALHNHFVFARPPVYFMHIGGTGDEASLAAGVRAMWDAAKAVRRRHPEPRSAVSERERAPSQPIDPDSLRAILPGEPSVNGGVVKFTFGRTATMRGVNLGASMGVATWAAFSGGQKHATVDGDFAMTAEEVQPIMRSLRRHDIQIVALHNHMIGEDTPMYFLHFWGVGDAEDLDRGVRAARAAQRAAAEETVDDAPGQ